MVVCLVKLLIAKLVVPFSKVLVVDRGGGLVVGTVGLKFRGPELNTNSPFSFFMRSLPGGQSYVVVLSHPDSLAIAESLIVT